MAPAKDTDEDVGLLRIGLFFDGTRNNADNLRHASLATTSMYLHTDDARRAKQVADRFAAPQT